MTDTDDPGGAAAAAAPVPIEGAMGTGTGADDEPEMVIGDKHGDGPDIGTVGVAGSGNGGAGTDAVEQAAEQLGATPEEAKEVAAAATAADDDLGAPGRT